MLAPSAEDGIAVSAGFNWPSLDPLIADLDFVVRSQRIDVLTAPADDGLSGKPDRSVRLDVLDDLRAFVVLVAAIVTDAGFRPRLVEVVPLRTDATEALSHRARLEYAG